MMYFRDSPLAAVWYAGDELETSVPAEVTPHEYQHRKRETMQGGENVHVVQLVENTPRSTPETNATRKCKSNRT